MITPVAFLGIDAWYQWVAILGLIALIAVWVVVKKKQQ
jgi:LPXTG-motif cell wall-anchored protein